MASKDIGPGVVTGTRIIITGGAGFLASNLVGQLSSTECRIVRITRQDGPAPLSTLGRAQCEFMTGNIGDRTFWEKVLPGVEFVFHFAAQTSVYFSDRNPVADWQANVLPMLGLLEACRESGHHPLILFAGSATQFGLPKSLPVNESHPDVPITIYDRHKIAAEAYLEHYVRQGWARGVTLRLANIYGPGPASGTPDRGILNRMMRKALKGEALTLYGAGRQLRDYLFVTDAVEGFLAAAAHASRVNGKHFILASGEGHTLAEVFHRVAGRAAAHTGRKVPVTSMAPPAGCSPIEGRSFIGDISRIRAATGWAPRTSLSTGIELSLHSLIMEQGSEP